MIKWEYFDLWTFEHEPQPNLGLLGADGWELVSVIYIGHFQAIVHYFKRPIPEETPATKIFNEVKKEVEGEAITLTNNHEINARS